MGQGAPGLPCLPGLVRLLAAARLAYLAALQHFSLKQTFAGRCTEVR